MPRFFRKKKKTVKPKLQTFTKKRHFLLKRRLKLIRKPEILSDAWMIWLSGLSVLVSDYLTFFDGVNRHLSQKICPMPLGFWGFWHLNRKWNPQVHEVPRPHWPVSRSSLRRPEPHGLHVPITAIINPTSDLNGSNGVTSAGDGSTAFRKY